jgi:hypothetical protein
MQFVRWANHLVTNLQKKKKNSDKPQSAAFALIQRRAIAEPASTHGRARVHRPTRWRPISVSPRTYTSPRKKTHSRSPHASTQRICDQGSSKNKARTAHARTILSEQKVDQVRTARPLQHIDLYRATVSIYPSVTYRTYCVRAKLIVASTCSTLHPPEANLNPSKFNAALTGVRSDEDARSSATRSTRFAKELSGAPSSVHICRTRALSRQQLLREPAPISAETYGDARPPGERAPRRRCRRPKLRMRRAVVFPGESDGGESRIGTDNGFRSIGRIRRPASIRYEISDPWPRKKSEPIYILLKSIYIYVWMIG